MKNQQPSDLINLLSFIITMVALTYLYIKKTIENRKHTNPEKHEDAQEKMYQEQLHRWIGEWNEDELEVEKRIKTSTASKKSGSKRKHHSTQHQHPVVNKNREVQVENRLPLLEVESSIKKTEVNRQQRAASIANLQKKASRAQSLLNTTSLRKSILIKEILGPPLAYKPDLLPIRIE